MRLTSDAEMNYAHLSWFLNFGLFSTFQYIDRLLIVFPKWNRRFGHIL
jgi:hypothetical protein